MQWQDASCQEQIKLQRNVEHPVVFINLPYWFLLITKHYFNLIDGGVPGGVVVGELLLLCGDVLCSGGMHTKQRSLGLGPKLIPPQLVHGGVGGGVHGPLILFRVDGRIFGRKQ